MQRQNGFLPPPEGVKGAQIDIEYVGPLARSQRMEEAVAVERLYEMAGNLAQLAPEIMDNLDHDAAIRSRAELLGVPKNIMKDPDQVAEIREQRMQEQQQQQAMEQAQQGVGMAGQVAQMTDKMNPENVESTEAGMQKMMESMQ
jgi:hypothetical protein